MTNPAGIISVELVDGTKVLVPDSLELITPYVLQEQGDWFEDEIKFLRQIVQPGNTIVDIGANYGVYALSLARKVGANGKVWAFEPATETAQLLRESSAANSTTWLQVVQQALSDHEGTAWLQMPGQAELNSLVNAASDDGATRAGPGEAVELTTLDRCLERFHWTAVDLLKIDAEGEEERILKGGAKFFQELSPLVMFEVKAGAELHLGLVKKIEQLGYQTFRLIPGLDALVPFATGEEVDGYLLNLFAAKPDRVATLAAAGRLVEQVNQEGPKAGVIALESWLQRLATQPYALSLAENWQARSHQPEQNQINRALGAWVRAQEGQKRFPANMVL
jgi:FkbM family methyltransferase